MKHIYQCLFLILSFSFVGMTAQKKASEDLEQKATAALYDNPDETIDIANSLLKKEKDPESVAHLYLLISSAYISKREIDSSLLYVAKTTNLINSNVQIPTKIRILNYAAVQYQQMELYNKALETLNHSQELCLKLPLNDYHRNSYFAFINIIRGMIYRSQSNQEMALEKFQSALAYYKNDAKDKAAKANTSVILYNMGYCYIELKQYDKAQTYFAESAKYAKLSEAKSLEAYALKGMAENHYLNQNYSQSLEMLHRAESLAFPASDLILNEGIYKLIADNYLAQNHYKNYQKYNQKYQQVKQQRQQKELKSLNRYLNVQTDEMIQKVSETQSRFSIYQAIILLSGIIALLILIKNIISIKKKNKQQKLIIDDYLKS